MGLLDQILGGAASAPRSAQRRGAAHASPVVKALMLALAAKAAQHYMQSRRGAGARPMDRPDAAGDLPGGLGGVLAGLGGAGALGALVDQFTRNGHGDAMGSWIGRGQNQRIAPHQLAEALGPTAVDELEVETGLSREQLLAELSDELPDAVDQLTPEGRLPDDREIGKLLS